MRVLLVTSDRDRCGIREWGRMLIPELEALGVVVDEYPDPDYMALERQLGKLAAYDLVHVNHHAALHSSWTAERVALLQTFGVRVVVTQHDTFETLQVMLERGFPDFRCAGALVTHELVEGLEYDREGRRSRVYYVQQGVPDAPPATTPSARVLGLFGFDFPHKNFDLAFRVAAEAGWAPLLISAGITPERQAELRAIHPQAVIVDAYPPQEEVVARLASCTATAFLATGGNSGTSATIRTGLAARRPLVAFKCRQFRDLYDTDGIWWANGEEDLREFLEMVEDPAIQEVQTARIRRLADSLSWGLVARKYLDIYKVVRGQA